MKSVINKFCFLMFYCRSFSSISGSSCEKTLCLSLIPLLSLALSLISPPAWSKVQTRPVEVISSTPIYSFSERAALWPSEEIDESSYSLDGKSLSDSFNSLPGLQSRESGSPTISIRGSAQADRVLKLYDGVPLNLADGIGVQDLFIPTESLGSLRIVKGPASVFYGASAMAGAIDHHPRLYERTALRLGVADDSGLLGSRNIFAALPFHTKDSSSADAQLTAFHEFQPGRYQYESVTTDLKGRRENNWKETTRLTGTGTFSVGSWRLRPSLLLAQQSGASPGSITAPYTNSFDYKGSLISLDGQTKFDEHIELSVRAADVRFTGLYDKGTGFETDSSTARTSAALDLGWLIGEKVLSHTFVDIGHDSLKASYLGDQSFSRDSFELGQSYEVPLTTTLTLQPALRWNNPSRDLFKAVGLHYANTDDHAWLTYSEGFRSPSLSDLHANTSYFKGSPDLKPEHSRSLEIGFTSERGRRFGNYLEGLSVGGSAYHTLYDELIDSVAVDTLATTKINTGRARASGAEVSLSYSFSVWTFGASHGWLDAKNSDSDEPLRLSPQQQTTISVSHGVGPFIIELKETIWDSYYDREFPSNNLRELPGWQTSDLNIRSLGFTDWEFKGGVTNIFNKPRELTISYPEPQRRFYASALHYF